MQKDQRLQVKTISRAGILFLAAGLIGCGMFSAKSAADTGTPAPSSKTLYNRYCSLCHGDQCQGAMGTPLQNMTMDDKDAIAVTSTGDGKQMPAFGQELTQNQIVGVIAYVHTYDTKKTAPPPGN